LLGDSKQYSYESIKFKYQSVGEDHRLYFKRTVLAFMFDLLSQ
jgi:hypothetical protein